MISRRWFNFAALLLPLMPHVKPDKLAKLREAALHVTRAPSAYYWPTARLWGFRVEYSLPSFMPVYDYHRNFGW